LPHLTAAERSYQCLLPARLLPRQCRSLQHARQVMTRASACSVNTHRIAGLLSLTACRAAFNIVWTPIWWVSSRLIAEYLDFGRARESSESFGSSYAGRSHTVAQLHDSAYCSRPHVRRSAHTKSSSPLRWRSRSSITPVQDVGSTRTSPRHSSGAGRLLSGCALERECPSRSVAALGLALVPRRTWPVPSFPVSIASLVQQAVRKYSAADWLLAATASHVSYPQVWTLRRAAHYATGAPTS
jgi:hypothetical protein